MYTPNLKCALLPEKPEEFCILKERNSGRYTYLVLSGQLWKHLADVNEQAHARLEMIVKQMQEAEGVAEELKAKDQ